jgi:IS5 family transposase
MVNSEGRKDIPRGVWNSTWIDHWLERIFRVLQFWATTSVALEKKQGLSLALALPGNPYDGHTVEAVLKQLKRTTGTQPKILIPDRGYGGEKDFGKSQLLSPTPPIPADTEYK